MSSLYYIHAPMNSGKSAQLLMVAHNYEETNHKIMIGKPKLDTRDGEYVKSRALNVKRKVDFTVEKEAVGFMYALVKAYKPDVLLIDEAQFLSRDQIDELAEIVDDFNIPVMAYGLRTDAFGNLFEGSHRLFEIADKFQEFKTVCPHCGRKAIINMRMDADNKPVFGGEQISPGTHYLPVCRKHYNELKKAAGN
jgi:thymidine kinase